MMIVYVERRIQKEKSSIHYAHSTYRVKSVAKRRRMNKKNPAAQKCAQDF
jgi:hypothetical protein